MELYLFVVVVLFGLAISDLIVGVSNDAVNFLNSAVGSKVAPRKVIMIIASIGMLFGVTFSSGMMEVARKGIFHPEYFIVTELLVIFLAVMITDIILLDLYNTFGLPTSTTVSIVFELLGSAVAVSIIKINHLGQTMAQLGNYINTSKALAIILGILISIVVAFSIGALVQYVSRLLFTFDFEKRLKRYGAMWGGLALMTITFFILIKGANGASWLTPQMVEWISNNTLLILGGSFVIWSVLLQLMMWLFKLNVLKLIVLVGTGSLAMAFAANDLVNFIGVPLAGFHAYRIAANNPIDPLSTSMEAMAGAVKTDTWMLLIAGAIMVVTLWISRKAQSVTKTEVGLGRQSEGVERFQPSVFSRSLVRMAMSLSELFGRWSSQKLKEKIANRFDTSIAEERLKNDKDRPAFDLLRASVNLMVASALISFGTSLKLPLSTTYVTFMVAMGTSLSDRAWGRESAVYRIAGVLTVVGGWFFTAFMAFTVSFVFATLIYHFRFFAIVALVLLAVFFIYRTHKIHKKREAEAEEAEGKESELEAEEPITQKMTRKCVKYFSKLNNILNRTIESLFQEDRRALRALRDEAKSFKRSGRQLVTTMFSNIQEPDYPTELSPRIVTALNGVGRYLFELVDVCSNHVFNQHRNLSKDQRSDIQDVTERLVALVERGITHIQADDRAEISKTIDDSAELFEHIAKYNKTQVKRIKKGDSKTRQSLLYFSILTHDVEILEEFVELLKGYNETFHPDE